MMALKLLGSSWVSKALLFVHNVFIPEGNIGPYWKFVIETSTFEMQSNTPGQTDTNQGNEGRPSS